MDAERPKPDQQATADAVNAVSAAKAVTVAESELEEEAEETEADRAFEARCQAEVDEPIGQEVQTEVCAVSGPDWFQRLEMGVCDDMRDGCTHDRRRVGCSRWFGTQRQNV